MIVAWRIDKQKHVETAFAGEGARRYGGRWNHKGTPVVYLSDSLALAALEKVVHLGKAVPRLRFIVFQVRLPKAVIMTLPGRRLPRNWREEPPLDQTKDVGTEWVRGEASAVLKVPSAIIPSAANYLVNPAHRDFCKLRISAPEPFIFDPRLWK